MGKQRQQRLLPARDRHVVSRFSYGVTPELARDVRRAGGAQAWFERQLTEPHRIADGRADRLRAWWPDHGHGNVMLVAGAGVRGGRYYGSWPGLANTLDADLPVTTDYRSVLSEVVTRRFGVSTAQVFPGFAPTPVGVMA